MATIADILLAQADLAGEAQRNRGKVLGSTIAALGQVPAEIIQQRDAAKARAFAQQMAQREAERKAANDARLVEQGDAKNQLERDKFNADTYEKLGAQATKEATRLAQSGDLSPQTVQAWVSSLKGVLFKPEHADALLSAAQTPEGATAVVRALAKPQAPPKREKVEVRRPDGSIEIRFVDPQTADPMVSAPVPEKPEKLTYGPLQQVTVGGRKTLARTRSDGSTIDMKGNVIQPDGLYEKPERVAPTEPLEIIVGPDGKPQYVPRSQAAGKRPASANAKPASGMEKRAFGFFNRARQADGDLESMEPEIVKMGLAGQSWMNAAPNFLQTELGQRYTQAQRAFTEARLRKDSGAAIPEQEFANDRRTYFPQPGDTKKTLEQKRRARASILASLGVESGQALGEYEGDADAATQIIQSYKERASGASGGSGGSGGGMSYEDYLKAKGQK